MKIQLLSLLAFMNTKLLFFVFAEILLLGGIVHAESADLCKFGLITADIVDKNTKVSSDVEVEKLRNFLRANLVDSKDILEIEQFSGRVYILANNISSIANGNACHKILKALPNYTEKKIVAKNEKFIPMTISIESIDRCRLKH